MKLGQSIENYTRKYFIQNICKRYAPYTSSRPFCPRQLMIEKNSFVNKIFWNKIIKNSRKILLHYCYYYYCCYYFYYYYYYYYFGRDIQTWSGNSDIMHWYYDVNAKYIRKVSFRVNFRIEWPFQLKMLIMSSR